MSDELATYRIELVTVQAALADKPGDQELKQLEADLLDIIELSSKLEAETQAQPKKASVATQWSVGDVCEALFAEDGQYYQATINSIDDDGLSCAVTFEDYGNFEVVEIANLKQLAGHKQKKAKAKAEPVVGPDGKLVPQGKTAEDREKEREKKKKKAEKRKAKELQKDEVANTTQSSWKKFNTGNKKSKSKNGFRTGKAKDSIFKTPDSADGKVGVGTNNMGGKGMTDFKRRDKWTYETTD